ncbi:MAG: sulfatase [Verrucomicrobiaceae bacterium]|nr:MAG: sulfatase [Verrucomicrobiaceae bacterium]
MIRHLILPLLALIMAAPAQTTRPNILWVISEDTGPHLGCYGTPEVQTPNLDRLAATGVRYPHFYAGMVCSVSRSSFHTGMHAVSIGAHNHRTKGKKPLPDGVRPITEWLKEAGYFTANITTMPAAKGLRGTGKMDWNFKTEQKPFQSDRWEDLKANQPFFAEISFNETHRAYHASAKADPAKVELPPYYPDHPVARADWAAYLDSISELDRKVGLVLEQLERDGLAENTLVVYFGDNGASMVRAKQFCYEEGFNVPCILRWPKNMPVPPQARPGTVDTRLIDAIDLAPTMLSLAGVPKPPKMQGRIFLGEKAEPDRQYVFGHRDRCDETVMRIRSVRDARFRYIRNFTPEVPLLAANAYKERSYPVWNLLKELNREGKLTPAQAFLCQLQMPAEELYDMEKDPHQIQNLAADPAYKTDVERLRGVLERWIEEVGDQGRFPEVDAKPVEGGR